MGKKKMAMKVEEIGNLCKDTIEIDDSSDIDGMFGVLDEISAVCSLKSGSAEDEISEIEDKAGITLSTDQKAKIKKKYDTKLTVDPSNVKAVNMIGIQARQIKKFLQTVTG